jgi:cephalosporin-C deacetylase-like acetyl esterase
VESWQKDVSAKLNELLGWAPDEKCELNVRQLEKTEARDYTRTKLVFTSEPYADVPCYLLIPKKARKPIPVCICLQGHTPGMHISLDAAGRAGDGDYAIQAVEEGFAALCIEQRCYGERREAKQEVRWQHGCFDAVMHSLALGRTMIGEKVYDVRRAIDMLEKEHAELDTAKIAITGCSGGGLGAFWAAAVDKRISASMPAGHFCTFADGAVRTVHCVEIYVPGILRWMEMHDVAGLIAPRPLVIITGDQDPIYPLAGVKQAYDKAAAIYAAAGAPGNVRLIVGEGGHRFYGRKEGSWKVLKELMGLLGSG